MEQVAGAASADEIRLLLVGDIGLPILSAASVRSEGAEPLSKIVFVFDELVRRAAEIGAAVAADLGVSPEPGGDGARWAAARLGAALVAAHYRSEGEVVPLALGIALARTVNAPELPAGVSPGTVADGLGPDRVGGRLEALAPIVGAVAEFAFGHDPAAMVVEILGHVMPAAARIGGRDDASGASSPEIGIAASLYLDAHRAEERDLLRRSPHQRQPRRPIPLDGIWRRFELSVDLLSLLGAGGAPASGMRGV